MSTTRVIVADDHILVRAGIVTILEDLGDYECIGSAESGVTCIAVCQAHPPDILLLDLNMPGIGGLEVLQILRETVPKLQIVILTSSSDAELARKAIALGAAGFVSKDFVLAELAMALACVREGRVYISPNIAIAAIKDKDVTAKLTPRQHDVLRCIAMGQSNKEIARELTVSIKTVEYHRSELMHRLDLHDVASLTRFAVSQGLVD